jgi:hypothetical protein
MQNISQRETLSIVIEKIFLIHLRLTLKDENIM